MNLSFITPNQPNGYSSHGYLTTFKDIVEIEQERDNEPFIHWSTAEIEPYADCEAIWVTLDPFEAFRYTLDAEESQQSQDELIQKYPKWQEDIETIDCSQAKQISETNDGDGGFVMVWL